jgi:CheY-like chemotaxis protein
MAKVLVIEDDGDIRSAYVFELKQAGFEVFQAADGAEAVPLFERVQPDIVLLDMLMPGLSGLDFLRSANISGRFPATKIVALSNIDTPRVVQQAKELGVSDYIIKVDTTPRQMVEALRQHLAAAPAHPAAPTDPKAHKKG